MVSVAVGSDLDWDLDSLDSLDSLEWLVSEVKAEEARAERLMMSTRLKQLDLARYLCQRVQ